MANNLKYTEDGYPFYDEGADDAFARAAERIRRSVKGGRLPIEGPEAPAAYLIEPDLLEAQQGVHLPPGTALNEAGIPYNVNTGVELPTVVRPNVLPIAKTPEGFTFTMPKVLDVVGNMMGGVAGVPVKGAEVLLGSGPVRRMAEEAVTQGPFFSALERAVDNSKVGKADAQQWLGYLKNQPGVKQEELNLVLGGIEGNLTKAEIQDIVKSNKVELKEVVKGQTKLPEGYKPIQLDDKTWAIQKPDGSITNKAAWREPEGAIEAFLRNTNGPTKYHSYQLLGGENYQEMLLSLPAQRAKVEYSMVPNKDGVNFDVIRTIDGNKEDYLRAVPRNEAEAAVDYGRANDTSANRYSANTFKSSHWDEPNILAHIRMNDRIVDGKKTLHIEEIQSDWGQAIRKSGYQLNPKEKEALEATAKSVDDKLIKADREDIMGNPDLKAGLDQAVKDKLITDKEAKDYLKLSENEHSTIPDMPFKKNWSQVAIKRIIHKAASEDYSGISWTPGEAQAARYDLSKHLDSVGYQKRGENTYNITAWGKNGGSVWSNQSATPEMIEQHLGKEMADKIIKGTGRKEGNFTYLEDLDLKIGGEGMKSFYDTIVKNEFNNIGKKYGAKVEYRKLNSDVTVPYFPITPQLKEKALKEGFELFSHAPILTPVQYNPFTSEDRKRYKLTPIFGNPFGG